jgi:hypothetical protein
MELAQAPDISRSCKYQRRTSGPSPSSFAMVGRATITTPFVIDPIIVTHTTVRSTIAVVFLSGVSSSSAATAVSNALMGRMSSIDRFEPWLFV